MKTTLEMRRQHLRKQLALVERQIVRTERRLRQLEVRMAQASQDARKAA